MEALPNRSYLKPLVIGCIVLLAAFLRCYHLFDIPLTNDELSALDRLHFSSCSELVRKGIMPDGHPSLVQVFLFYYTKLTGLSPALIKLPFILCGTYSVYAAYQVTGRLLNNRTGLLVAAFMATSQFFIMHSQTARPYAPGLLFVLLLAQQLLVVSDGKARKRNAVFIAVLLFLLASTHYIAALTGVVLTLLFLLYAPRARKELLIASAAAFLLYIPQLPVFLTHLKVGGIGTWLGKPQPGFIIDFIRYLTQFNWVVLLLLCTGAMASLFMILREAQQRKKLLIVPGVFVITYLVLYFYSVLRNPLLQYPALLFATPFLLAFTFYVFTRLPKLVYAGTLLMLVALQCYSLTVSRRHYQVFYNQSYKATVETILKHAKPYTPLLLNGNAPYYFDLYFKQAGFKPNVIHTRIDTLTYADFHDLLISMEEDTIVIAHAFDLPLEYFSVTRSLFPDSVYAEQNAFNETWVLARKPGWTIYGPSQTFDRNHTHGVPVTFSLSGPLRFRLEAQSNIIQPETGIVANPELALSVKNSKGEQVLWRSGFYRSFNTDDRMAGKIFVTSEIVIPAKDTFRFDVFIINGRGETFTAAQPKVRVSKANGLLFGTVEPIGQ